MVKKVMRTLVCPLGGSSSRFPPDFRPKWKNNIFGRMMITQAVQGCHLDCFDNIVFVVNKKQVKFVERIERECPGCKVVVVDDTRSAPEAVYKGLKCHRVDSGGLLIRDCDSLFDLPRFVNWDRNWVAVNDIHNVELVNARNKSYVKIDSNNTIGNIAEKHVISNLFNVGAYYFKNINDFNCYYNKLCARSGLYVSDIIYQMLLDKHLFFSEIVTGYVDLGTWDDLLRYYMFCRNNKSIVVDVDKTIFVKNVNDDYGHVKPVNKMVSYLKKMQDEGFYIVLFTSRNMNSFNNNLGWINKHTVPVLVDTLHRFDVPFDELFMGKPWTGRGGFILDDKNKNIGEVLKG